MIDKEKYKDIFVSLRTSVFMGERKMSQILARLSNTEIPVLLEIVFLCFI